MCLTRTHFAPLNSILSCSVPWGLRFSRSLINTSSGLPDFSGRLGLISMVHVKRVTLLIMRNYLGEWVWRHPCMVTSLQPALQCYLYNYLLQHHPPIIGCSKHPIIDETWKSWLLLLSNLQIPFYSCQIIKSRQFLRSYWKTVNM